jgi:preprotein translocase subunit SecG
MAFVPVLVLPQPPIHWVLVLVLTGARGHIHLVPKLKLREAMSPFFHTPPWRGASDANVTTCSALELEAKQSALNYNGTGFPCVPRFAAMDCGSTIWLYCHVSMDPWVIITGFWIGWLNLLTPSLQSLVITIIIALSLIYQPHKSLGHSKSSQSSIVVSWQWIYNSLTVTTAHMLILLFIGRLSTDNWSTTELNWQLLLLCPYIVSSQTTAQKTSVA